MKIYKHQLLKSEYEYIIEHGNKYFYIRPWDGFFREISKSGFHEQNLYIRPWDGFFREISKSGFHEQNLSSLSDQERSYFIECVDSITDNLLDRYVKQLNELAILSLAKDSLND